MSGRKSSTRKSRKRRERAVDNFSPDGEGGVSRDMRRGSPAEGYHRKVKESVVEGQTMKSMNGLSPGMDYQPLRNGSTTKGRKATNGPSTDRKVEKSVKTLTPDIGDHHSPLGGGRERWWKKLFSNDSQQQEYRSRSRSTKKRPKRSYKTATEGAGGELISESNHRSAIPAVASTSSLNIISSGFTVYHSENTPRVLQNKSQSMDDILASHRNGTSTEHIPTTPQPRRSPSVHKHHQLPRRADFKVKFGCPLEQVCKNDIPGPLLVLILKLNKEGPAKKDVFRAPGHQGSMKKLIHFLQNGRLVNIDNFSVYTIASVLKKFLRKLPDGIFGQEGERELFSIIQLSDTERQRDRIHRLITSMPIVTQHLLVLLFGTFRVIAMNSSRAQTGMTSEALGVSVAPSFFQSCVADGKTARMEDVMRFKVATQIMKFLIDNFGVSNLFGRANYEYYARITGRILKVEEDWIFAFRYPPDSMVARQISLDAEKTWLQYESERWGIKFNLEGSLTDSEEARMIYTMAGQEESQSTPALIHIPETSGGMGVHGMAVAGGASQEVCGAEGGGGISGVGVIGGVPGVGCSAGVPENNLRESCTRLSISLEENGLYKVHERQTERMRTRSEWFLSHSQHPSGSPLTPVDVECQPHAVYVLRSGSINRPSSGSGSSETVGSGVRRSSSKEKGKLVRRSSSKKDKENGQKGSRGQRSSSADVKTPGAHHAGDFLSSPRRRATPPTGPDPSASTLTDLDCTETDVQRVHVSLTYKPRI